ncbi:MAG: ParA family protein, partial [Tissierellia bacterium]|nr:ParA family protein [Tissierellia bacterium]
MGKTIGIFNQKGGVGKTTTAINLAAGLGRRNKKVLLIDLDPQGNATSGLGIDKESIELNVYDAIHNETPMEDIVIETNGKNLWLVPSDIDLAGLEIELAQSNDWHRLMENALLGIKDSYDIIIIDCPPSLGILSIMSLIASDYVLIPIQSEFYALEGTGQLLETIKMVQENYNPNLEILGVVMVMHDSRTRLSSDVVEEVKN